MFSSCFFFKQIAKKNKKTEESNSSKDFSIWIIQTRLKSMFLKKSTCKKTCFIIFGKLRKPFFNKKTSFEIRFEQKRLWTKNIFGQKHFGTYNLKEFILEQIRVRTKIVLTKYILKNKSAFNPSVWFRRRMDAGGTKLWINVCKTLNSNP